MGIEDDPETDLTPPVVEVYEVKEPILEAFQYLQAMAKIVGDQGAPTKES